MTPPPTSLARSLAAIALAIGLGAVGACSGPNDAENTTTTPAVTQGAGTVEVTYDVDGQPTALTYPGRTGMTVLDLLREVDSLASIQGEGESAFVTGIEGRAADQGEQQFWALYVDGAFAEVGAGVLETTDGQVIEWKLETWE